MMTQKLFNKTTGNEVKEGDTVTNFRGEKGVLETISSNEGNQGKVYVKYDGMHFAHSNFPSVIDCEFRKCI